MSSRGRSFGGRGSIRGGNRGADRRNSANYQRPTGPPTSILELGNVSHTCEGEVVCASVNPKIPYFNAPVYLENKAQVGIIDEILGPIDQVYFTVKTSSGINAESFKSGDKVFVSPDKLLPVERFLPKPKPIAVILGIKKSKKKTSNSAHEPSTRRGSFRGSSRGGRGGSNRGRGSFNRSNNDRYNGSCGGSRNFSSGSRSNFTSSRGRGGRGNFHRG